MEKLNPKNSSSILKYSNGTIIEKLKNIKLQLSKFRISKNRLFNNNMINNINNNNNKKENKIITAKQNISILIKINKNNDINKIPSIKTNANSPKTSSILIKKKLSKNKNIKLNYYNIFNFKNNININRSFENRKYKKLKNKTPEMSRVSSTKYNKNSIIKYKYLNQSNINNNNSEKEGISKLSKMKQYDNINIKLKKIDNKTIQNQHSNNKKKIFNKKIDKKKNNSVQMKENKKNLNIFTDYLKNSRETQKNKFIQNNFSENSNNNSISIIKSKNNYYLITPLNNDINNIGNKKVKMQNGSPNSLYYSTIHNDKSKNHKNSSNKDKINVNNSNISTNTNNHDIAKYKNNSNLSFYLKKQKNNIYKNYQSNIKSKKENNKKNKFFTTSVNSSLNLEQKLNIKVKCTNKKNSSLSQKKKNNMNNSNSHIKEKMKQILSQSQQEIMKIKDDFAKHFTYKNSPQKNGLQNISISKKSKNSSQTKNSSKNKIIKFNNNYNIVKINYKINVNKKICKINNKNYKKKNKEIKNNGQINGKKIEDLKNGLLIKEIHPKHQSIINLNESSQNKNYYLNESIKLSNYIKEYFKEKKEYPKTNLNFYKYGRLIGQGSFGKVNIGLNVLSGRIVAIKSFNKEKLGKNSENMKKIIYESNLMKRLNHPNITKILEMFEDEKYFLIIMEYINGGNLFSFVKKRRKLSEKTAKFLFKQIILGIQHMHNKNIVHRDIKLENILIDLNNNVKICDFGISLVLNSLSDKLYDQCGTPMYMAPEILLSNKANGIGYMGPPVDIWAAGISLYILLSGNLPFNITDISNEIKNGKDFNGEYNNNKLLQYCILNFEPKKINDISDLAQSLLKRILNKNPKKRLTCEQILNDPWLNFDDNHKYHLFTKAEMIMLSKTFIDYRYSKDEDLLENFTMSNLKNDINKNNKDKNIDNNIESKSSIFTPYNSVINETSILYNNISNKDSIIDDEKNTEIKVDNDYLIYSNKAKELNMIYELNNNEEIDNGVIINSKTNSTSSNRLNNSKENNYFENGITKNLGNKLIIKNNNIGNNKEKIHYILESIETMGYDKQYAFKIIKNNELSQVYAIYFLLDNYDKF